MFDDETLTSYCSRLAAANATTATDFCKDMGFQFQDVINGSASAVRELAEHGAIPIVRLQMACVRDVARELEVNGEVFPRKAYPRTRLRICPSCLQDDDASEDRMPGTRRFMRRSWALRFLRTCPEHQRPIVDLGPSPLGSPRNHDFTEGLEALYDDVRVAMMEPWSRRELSDFEWFLLRRLDGCKRDGELLDGMSLYAGAHLCEIVGSVRLFGTKITEKELSEDKLWAAAKDGYEFLREGQKGLIRFLDVMHARHPSIPPDCGGQKLYGRMYNIMRESADPFWVPIKNAIRDYAFAVLPLIKSSEIFGRREDSEYLSDTEIQELAAMRPGHVRKMAVASGLIDPSLLTGGAIPRSVVMRLIDLLKDWLLPVEAAKLLGVTYANFKLQSKAGKFAPAVTSTNGVEVYERYSRREIEEYLRELRLKATTDAGPEGLQPVLAAAKSLHCKISDIIDLVDNDRLITVGWDERKIGWSAILVDPEEVAEAVKLNDGDKIVVDQLARIWGLSSEIIWALVNQGAIPTVAGYDKQNRHNPRVVRREDAEAFHAKYVTFTNAARDFGVTRRQIAEAVRRADLLPLYNAVGALFYDRSNIQIALSER
nr:TniQ family protein [Rhizobium binae]